MITRKQPLLELFTAAKTDVEHEPLEAYFPSSTSKRPAPSTISRR